MTTAIFGISPIVAETAIMGDFSKMHHGQLSPKEIPSILRRFTTLLQKRLEEVAPTGSDEESVTIPLQELLLPISFQAVSESIFGSGLPVDKMYPLFVRFNRDVHLLAAQMPRLVTGGAQKAWDDFIVHLRQHLENPHPDAAELVHEGERICKDAGWVCASSACCYWAISKLISGL
jgi:hypothetical protein